MQTYNFAVKKFPSAVLRKKTKKVSNITDEIRTTIKKMVRIMREKDGIGLAAPQVGLNLRIAVIDAGGGLIKLINPVIIKKDGVDIMDEGCLSIPSVLVRVKRAKTVTIEYTDEWGKTSSQVFNGLTSKAIQHEVDHLDGKLIIDYLPWFKRLLVTRRLKCL